MTDNTNDSHFLGHRKRLKDKFLQAPLGSLADYELIELLLFLSIPRKDVKPLSKTLLHKFGCLGSLIHAEPDRLMDIKGMNQGVYTNIKLIREILQRSLRTEVMNQNVLSSWAELLKYLRTVMGHIKYEQFRILFLDKRNKLIADEIQAEGTIDQTPVYPREVVRRTLFHAATAIVLVHNHPSGDPNPSKADIELTKHIIQACKAINVIVHDHVIITKNDFFSFKTNMLM